MAAEPSGVDGLHAVVTGGGSGIGAAIARELLGQGARVTLMGRGVERLQQQGKTLASIGQVEWRAVDVGDEDSVRTAFAAIDAVDVLVNNAGMAESAALGRTSLELWQRTLQVNLTGSFLCAREVADAMARRGFGRIVNIASTAALTGYAYVAAYCAAKHGVLGLTRSMAQEFARHGVTVNAVCPGYTDTELIDRAVETVVAKTGRSAEQARAQFAAANPQGRLVQPDEVAAAVAWLARRDSRSINGQAIGVSGGETT